jgi:hypothetical protein
MHEFMFNDTIHLATQHTPLHLRPTMRLQVLAVDVTFTSDVVFAGDFEAAKFVLANL